MKHSHQRKCLTLLWLGLVSLAALAFLPGISVGAPPPGAFPDNAAAGSLGTSATTIQAEQVNQTLGLLASSIVTLGAVPATADVPAYVDVPINGEVLTLDLMPQSVRAPDYHVWAQLDDGSLVEVEPQPARTMRGTVAGFDDSAVAASVLDAGLYARIILSEGDEYWIEPLAPFFPEAASDQYVVYRGDDIIPSGYSCGADMIPQPGGEESGGFGTREACGNGVICVAELACDADYPYYQRYGSVSAVENRINNVINTVNVQYERDVEITHEITGIIVRSSSAADPYDTTDPSTLLDEFRSEWQSHHGDIQRDLAELFTARNLTGSVIGIAWINAVCTSLGYSVVQSDCCGSLGCATDLSAHEMGHNWGASHCTCSGWTMNPSLTCANRFHATYTIPDIVSYRSSHQNCLTAGAGACPVHFSTQPGTQSVCLGDSVSLTVFTDAASPQYQWRRGSTNLVNDGVHIFGATSDTLLIVNVDFADEGNNYNCVVYDAANDCSVTSDDASINVDNNSPVITAQPQDATADEGTYVTFHVGIESPILYDFQWRVDGAALSEGGRYFGTTTDTFMIVPLELGDAGQYDCQVTDRNGGCSTVSDAATLTVNAVGNNCPEDLVADGVIDLQDLSALLGNYGMSGATPADGDFNGDGNVDLADLSQLLGVYGQSCPTR